MRVVSMAQQSSWWFRHGVGLEGRRWVMADVHSPAVWRREETNGGRCHLVTRQTNLCNSQKSGPWEMAGTRWARKSKCGWLDLCAKAFKLIFWLVYKRMGFTVGFSFFLSFFYNTYILLKVHENTQHPWRQHMVPSAFELRAILLQATESPL